MQADQALVARVLLTGDRRAFEHLLRRHQGMVRAQLRRLLRDDPARADDLAQETFLLAWRKLHQFRGEPRFSTWLYKIAANASIDHLRKRRIQALSLDRPLETKDGTVEFEVPDYSYHPGRDLERKEHRFSIDEAIDSLPPKYREVIIYRHKDDKSYEEIADLLDIPVGTVKARIFRARELLKKKLKNI